MYVDMCILWFRIIELLVNYELKLAIYHQDFII